MTISVIAVCGMPGSGKGEFSRIMEKYNIPILSMGDLVREELSNRGLDETPENVGKVAIDLRAKFGDGVIAERLAPRVESIMADNALIIIEGIRGIAEYDIFKNLWADQFKILAVECDVEVRWNRIKIRGRGDDGDRAAFNERDRREESWGLGKLLSISEIQIANNSDIQTFESEVMEWLKVQ